MKHHILVLLTLVIFQAQAFAGPLDGVWVNPDKNTRGIAKAEIRGTEFYWSSISHPGDQREGPYQITLLAASVDGTSPGKHGIVVSDEGFAKRIYIFKRQDDQLVIESATVFKDPAKRSNYFETVLLTPQK